MVEKEASSRNDLFSSISVSVLNMIAQYILYENKNILLLIVGINKFNIIFSSLALIGAGTV